MIELKHFKTKESMAFKTPAELKKMLKFCNPTWFEYYQDQMRELYPNVELRGIGRGVKVVRKDLA